MSQATVTTGTVVENDASQRSQAMIAHLAGIFGILGTGIFYLVKKNDPATGSFVKEQIKEAFNFHCLVLVAVIGVNIVTIVLAMVMAKLALLGSLAGLAIFLGTLFLVITNAMKANKGEFATYPAKIKVLK